MCVPIHGNVPVKCETNPAQPEGTRPRSQLAASAPPHPGPWAQGQGHCLVDLRHPRHPGRRARAPHWAPEPHRTAGTPARAQPPPRPPRARAPPSRLPSPGPEGEPPQAAGPSPAVGGSSPIGKVAGGSRGAEATWPPTPGPGAAPRRARPLTRAGPPGG